MSNATVEMTNEDRKKVILAAADRPEGITVTEIKDKVGGHAGRTALLFTAMCRPGRLKKTEDKRDGKFVYVVGDGTPMKIKRRSKKQIQKDKENKSSNEVSKVSDSVSNDKVVEAGNAGVSVGHHLMEAKKQIDAFIDGLRSSLS